MGGRGNLSDLKGGQFPEMFFVEGKVGGRSPDAREKIGIMFQSEVGRIKIFERKG